MKTLFLIVLLLFFTLPGEASIKICSWNLKDFGKSKSDKEIRFIANIINQFDVVAIQEVVKGWGGAQAVARLAGALNSKGSKWDYTISDPTSGSTHEAERYAYMWKTQKVSKKGKAWLERKYGLEISREPFFITLNAEGKNFTLVNFHATTKSKQPETEIKFFKFLPAFYPALTLIFAGDFNLPQSHSVFNPLKKMGYQPLLSNQKTSLRQRCINNDCLASEFDNMFFMQTKFKVKTCGIVPFYNEIKSFADARLISDHVPVFAEIEFLK